MPIVLLISVDPAILVEASVPVDSPIVVDASVPLEASPVVIPAVLEPLPPPPATIGTGITEVITVGSVEVTVCVVELLDRVLTTTLEEVMSVVEEELLIAIELLIAMVEEPDPADAPAAPDEEVSFLQKLWATVLMLPTSVPEGQLSVEQSRTP